MQLRALCKRFATDCVDSYLSSGKIDLRIDLKTLQSHYKRGSEIESDYLNGHKNKCNGQNGNRDIWNNKGKDLLNETLAEFGFQTKSTALCVNTEECSIVYEFQVKLERLKEEA